MYNVVDQKQAFLGCHVALFLISSAIWDLAMRWQAIEYGLPHPPAYHRYIMKATTTALRSGFFLVWRLDIGLRVVSEDGHPHRYSNNIIATFSTKQRK